MMVPSEPKLPTTRERHDSARSGDGLQRSSEDVDDSIEHPEEPEESEPEASGIDHEREDTQRVPRRAAFLDDLPDSELLEPLMAAFVDGNYAQLRTLERALASKTTDPEILAAARELVERTEPDPLSKKLLGLSILFFLFIVGWVYLHHAH